MDPDPQQRVRLFLRRSTTADGTACLLVTDAHGLAHRPLSHFLRFASTRYAPTTVSVYAHALIRYFSWLGATHRRWDSAMELARGHCMLYLDEALSCRVREHHAGFAAVNASIANATRIRLFLAAARAFYSFAIRTGLYPWSHPLERLGRDTGGSGSSPGRPDCFPRMPQASGVAVPDHPPRGRQTTAYFVLVNEQWLPRIIDDPSLPRQLLDAGQQTGWRLREQLVTRLLFETGARISEICGLTLDDWHACGLRCEASAFSKGSGERRVKLLRFSDVSARLLRRYFDRDRCAYDPRGWRLADYLRCGDITA